MVSTLGNVKSFLRKSGLLKQIIDLHGYCQVNLSGGGLVKKFKVHRIVLSAFNGLDESSHVDHINGNRQDNRLCNLRECTLEDNLRFNNVKKRKTSKFVGVSLRKNGKWCAQIQISKKKVHLGYHNTENEAKSAYDSALNEYNKRKACGFPKHSVY